MKHGDISNVASTRHLAINAECFFQKQPNKSLLGKLLPKINYDIVADLWRLAYIDKLNMTTDLMITLVLDTRFDEEFRKHNKYAKNTTVYDFLHENMTFFFSRVEYYTSSGVAQLDGSIIDAPKLQDINWKIKTGQYMYYVDDDAHRRNIVSLKYSFPFSAMSVELGK